MLVVLFFYLSACGGGLLELAGRFSPSLSPAASSQPNRWVLRLWPRIYIGSCAPRGGLQRRRLATHGPSSSGDPARAEREEQLGETHADRTSSTRRRSSAGPVPCPSAGDTERLDWDEHGDVQGLWAGRCSQGSGENHLSCCFVVATR